MTEKKDAPIDFHSDMDRLAAAIAKEALSQTLNFGERLEALRVLTTFGKDIVAKREAEPEADVFDFKAAQKRVREVGEE